MKLKALLQSITQVNQLPISASREWLFYPGMLFGSCAKWWADWKVRYTAHEGLDITFYRTLSGDIGSFDPTVMVPAMADGTVLNICDDFLGQSVIINHGESDPIKESHINHVECDSIEENHCNHQKAIVAAVYSHICVEKYSVNPSDPHEKELLNNHLKAQMDIEIGMSVVKGQILGKVADTSMKKSGILPHLHISLIEIPATTHPHELNWNLFANPSCDRVRFLNPLWL